jgi:hypothetical protein
VPVDFNRVSFAISEYRKTGKRQDLSVQTRDPLATELEFSTLLESQQAANAFGDEVLYLRKFHGRNDWVLNIKKGAINPEIGDTIVVTYPRFGLQSGKSFIVKRMKRSQAGLFDEFTLYGPKETVGYVEPPTGPVLFDSTLITIDSTQIEWDS